MAKLLITQDHIENKWNCKVKNAEQRNIPLCLTKEEFFYVWNNARDVCDLSKLPMVADNDKPESATLDRLDEKGSYCIDNIAVVRKDVNDIKNFLVETKIDSPKKPTIKDKKVLAKICKTLYNPIELTKIKDRYSMTNKMQETPSKSNTEAPTQELLTNPELCIAESYSRLGRLIEGVAEFSLTFAQYKNKMRTNSCGLTKRKFTEDDKKCLYWVDKQKPFSVNNTIITTVQLQTALDIFTASAKLNLTSLQSLCKVLSNYEVK